MMVEKKFSVGGVRTRSCMLDCGLSERALALLRLGDFEFAVIEREGRLETKTTRNVGIIVS